MGFRHNGPKARQYEKERLEMVEHRRLQTIVFLGPAKHGPMHHCSLPAPERTPPGCTAYWSKANWDRWQQTQDERAESIREWLEEHEAPICECCWTPVGA